MNPWQPYTDIMHWMMNHSEPAFIGIVIVTMIGAHNALKEWTQHRHNKAKQNTMDYLWW